MATNNANVRVAVSGAVFKGPLNMTAPSGTSGAPTGATDLGWCGEDGVEMEVPGTGDSNAIKAWQGGSTVRTIRTPSDDVPTWKVTLLETKLAVVELYFGVTVTTGSTEGSFEYTVKNRDHFAFVFDYVDGTELIRDYVPYGIVSDVGAITRSSGDPSGYEVTIAGEMGLTGQTYNFKQWATALKTGAAA